MQSQVQEGLRGAGCVVCVLPAQFKHTSLHLGLSQPSDFPRTPDGFLEQQPERKA